MDKTKEKIRKELTRLKNVILANMKRENVNASHRTEKSLVVVDYPGGVKLAFAAVDRAPMETLEVGRPGGAVPRGFYYIIKQWSIDKGIRFERESKRNTFAYFLSKRIAAEGTLRHAMPVDIYTKAAKESAKVCTRLVVDAYLEDIKTNLLKIK